MNSSNEQPSWRTELEALCELGIEGQLSDADRLRIEALVAADPAARRFYVDYLHQHAVLSWAAGKPEMVGARASSVSRVSLSIGGGEGPASAAAARSENTASV